MRLAFLGDSLTYGWLDEGREAWNERFEPLGAGNFGVPGDLTDDVLARIESGELDAARPETLVFLAGTNDLGSGRSPERAVRGVEACLRALRERFPAGRIVLLALLPRGDGGPPGYAQIAAVNAQLELLACRMAIDYEDCATAFVDRFGQIRSERYDADLLHVSGAGYAAWASVLSDAAALRAAFSAPNSRR